MNQLAMNFKGQTYSPERDGQRLTRQYDVVLDYVLGNGWVTLGEIELALNFPQASISARLRDFRRAGFKVERQYCQRGLHKYMITKEIMQ